MDRLENAPPIQLKDSEGWLKAKTANDDAYGRAIWQFAERWARLMQIEISQGCKLADVAQACCQEADTEGITGFMYGCAVSTLSQAWEHGEELRRWHNLDTQIQDEGEKANESGGVLNPALMTVGIGRKG